jgi:hypothetical protein
MNSNIKYVKEELQELEALHESEITVDQQKRLNELSFMLEVSDICEHCGDILHEENNSYDSEKCDSCLEYEADKRESYKGETY